MAQNLMTQETTNDAGAVAAAIIFREARLLDSGEWADWVAMYREDAVYWVPAWLDEYETTNDPTRRSRCFITMRGAGWKSGSRASNRASRSPRCRCLAPCIRSSNLEASETEPGRFTCHSVFSVHVYDPRVAKGMSTTDVISTRWPVRARRGRSRARSSRW